MNSDNPPFRLTGTPLALVCFLMFLLTLYYWQQEKRHSQALLWQVHHVEHRADSLQVAHARCLTYETL